MCQTNLLQEVRVESKHLRQARDVKNLKSLMMLLMIMIETLDSKQVLVNARANLEVAVGESPNVWAGLHHRALPCFQEIDRCHLVDFYL